jgi:hypothetical protein
MAKIIPWYLFGEKDPDRPDRAQDKLGFRITEINGDYVRSAKFFSREFLAKRISDVSDRTLILDDHSVQKNIFQRIGSYKQNFNLHFVDQADWNTGNYEIETGNCNERTQKYFLMEAFLVWAKTIEEAHE